MKIAFFEVEPWECKKCMDMNAEHEIVLLEKEIDINNVGQHADAEIISTFINSKLSAGVLEKFNNLKMIATRSTGYDHIDIEYCNANDIVVSNVPSYGENTVAEHVFGLLLTISHNIMNAVNRVRRGDFSLQGLKGFDLRGKTLGVVGTGNIGQCVIETARGFRMEVLAYDVEENKQLADKLKFRYVDMEQLLADSDIITLHVPENDATYHLISDEEFSKMKDGVIVINTARGNIIDNRALLYALTEGKVASAGLDVLPEEPIIKEEAEIARTIFQKKHNLESLLTDHILLRLNNVYITPHSAFFTKEAVQRIVDTTIENIVNFINSSPQNIVTAVPSHV
jgi:D-lactate dehydrogenase